MLYLIGAKTQSDTLGKVDVPCPQCSRRACMLYTSDKKATLFFMPVATLKRGYQASCGSCGNRWNLDLATGARLHLQLKATGTIQSTDGQPNPALTFDNLRKANAAMGMLQKLRKAIGMDREATPQSAPAPPATLSDAEARAALQTAAGEGDIKQMKALLKKGVDANSRDNSGWTALMRAADHGHLEAVKLLLENGADVTNISKNGFTALMRAFVNHHSDIVDLLRQSGAKN